MFLAIKANREVKIEEHEQDAYLKAGYDIYSCSEDKEIKKIKSADDNKAIIEKLNTEIANLKKQLEVTETIEEVTETIEEVTETIEEVKPAATKATTKANSKTAK